MKNKYLIVLFILIFSALSCGINSCGNEEAAPGDGLFVYGDSRTNHDDHRRVVRAILKKDPKAVFHTGDLVDDGTIPGQWEIFDDITSELRSEAEFFPALGNHEKDSDLYFDRFELPNNERWYSVNRAGVHFIILDSCSGIEKESEQYKWLESDLREAEGGFSFIVAVFHHPPFSTGPHSVDEMGLREIIVPLLEKYDVDIVFSGHDHSYERSLCNGIYYVVSGGGGAPLYDQERDSKYSQVFRKINHFCEISVTPESLVVCAYDTLNARIDRFSVPSE
ncbi:MAG: metallophosphoesterase [Candidatus Krumholzibacteriota bacterium]|nr:metallophosphoesterase [Candidatus Krumholzibacteriota bacterium]